MKITLQLLSFAIICIGVISCQQAESQSSETESTVGLLQHNVYFYLNDGVTSEEIAQFETGLEELVGIEEVYKAEVGVPGSTEVRDVTDHSFVYSIFTWFETIDDYNVYADHPDHLEFIDTYNHLWADVKVYDSELIFNR
ncbi:MAG: Dabb family protein [Balneolaceae bacterium]